MTPGAEGQGTVSDGPLAPLTGSAHRILLYCVQRLIVTGVLLHYVVRVSLVQGASMMPGVVNGERIIVDLLAYRLSIPHRGDVIVFQDPCDRSKDYIKRVIALPGETIEIRDGVTYVDGKSLPEPYVTLRDDSDLPPTTLASNCIWVMGDNRSNSEDSRTWGPLPLSLVRGQAVLSLWPPSRTFRTM